MCGIAAIVGGAAARSTVERMLSRLRHRGPDDENVWVAPRVALGHRRLSILDLSAAGRQPMTSHCGRYQMIFNGEIFNYKEIAATLPHVAWRSSSDTEVLLEAFAARGPKCLHELIGMYAFTIWDTVERRLFCARDRIGIKPFYYAPLGDGWVVASEAGALFAAGIEARANESVIYDFLGRDFYDHTDETFFAGIMKLPAGHWMWLSDGGSPAPQRYWSLSDDVSRTQVPATREARGEELVQRLERAVALALRSDVPVGITLSGGLDSSTLLALIARAQPERALIDAFAFDFADAAYSERTWTETASAHAGTRARYRIVSNEDFAGSVDRIMLQQQEPHAGAPIVAYTLCFEELRKSGTIVVMDGSGIDEALAGYERFQPAHWADLFGQGKWDELEEELVANRITTAARRHRALDQMTAASSAHGDIGKGQDLTASVRPDCLTERFVRTAPPLPIFERPFPDALRNLMYRELRYTKLPRALRFRDRLSMAYGCELRPPFLDHTLLAFMYALPAEDRIKGGRTKVLLRDSIEPFLPNAVRAAPKRAIQTPQREWFRGPLAAWVREQVDQDAFWDRGWVDRTRALGALERFQAGSGSNSFFIWQWIALHRWAMLFLR